MQTTARRYSTPVTPPPLVTRPAAARPLERRPLLSLRGASGGHSAPSLVAFNWGRVVTPATRR